MNLFACLLEVISTFRLFREINSSLQRYIDLKRGYMGGGGGGACFKIFQVTLNFDFLSKSLGSCHM